jgi:maltooligosyltrehalose trehalohydrolase
VATLATAREGDEYWLESADRQLLPDPWSIALPQGASGPSALWAPPSRPTPLARLDIGSLVIVQAHVGTGTAAGDLDSLRAAIPDWAAAGFGAVQLLPLGAHPGGPGWGYDAVFPFAVSARYGGPGALWRFVCAAHESGLAVIADCVFNHLGPRGSVWPQFDPAFFDHRRQTPWGASPSFRPGGWGAAMALQHATFWRHRFGVDGVRLDAIHAVSKPGIVERVVRAAQRDGSLVLAEDAAMAAQSPDGLMNDSLHHALHVALTGERERYYRAYDGEPAEIARALGHGTEAARRVNFLHNHDQIANRPRPARLAALSGEEAWRAAATFLSLAPGIPAYFMGDEVGSLAPFHYFASFGDSLDDDIARGRANELGGSQIPPASPDAVERSRPSPGQRPAERRAFLAALAALRAESRPREAALAGSWRSTADHRRVELRWGDGPRWLSRFERAGASSTLDPTWRLRLEVNSSRWRCLLACSE